MNYINGKSGYGILALAFTQEDRLREYLEKNKIDLALACEEFDMGESAKKVIRLCKEDGKGGIYKYQPASDIILELQKALEKEYCVKKVESIEEYRGCRLIGIYSPIGRSGKTNLALALAREAGSLYIGMEEYSDLVEGRTTMSDFCYWIRKKEGMIVRKVEEHMKIEEGVCKLVSPLTYMDLKELTVDEYDWFFEKIKQSGKFRKIVVDIGSGSLCSYSFLTLFDKIFVPILPEISSGKERHFKKVVQFVGLEKSGVKFEYIVVPRQDFNHIEMTEFVSSLERKI